MAAFTQALDTSGQNIANVNTPGYSRQVVNFQDTTPTPEWIGKAVLLGNGVNVASITSVRDLFLLGRKLGSSSDLGSTNQQLSGANQIQSAFNEPGSNGISSALNGFYNAWSTLATNPGDSSSLIAVQQAGQTVADRVRGTYGTLQDLQTQTNTQITSTIGSIQNLANQVAQLNQEIRAQQVTGGSANGLVDQRDQALQQLAGLVDINTQTNADGTVTVNVNQFQLIHQSGANTFPTSYSAANGTVTDANGTYSVLGGQLAGLFQQLNSVTNAMGDLDNIANSLRTQVNTIMKTGTNGLGATGQNFFNDVTPPTPQTGAIDFDLDPAVKANYKAIAAGVTGNGGDGGVALAISQAQSTAVAGLGNASITNYYTNTINGIGTQVNYLTSQQSTQQALGTQIDNQIQSVSGVSLDEEMANLVKFQQSYQSAAKSLSMADQNLQYLMSMIPA